MKMDAKHRAAYLDCAATTPIEPRVLAEMCRVWVDEPGNAGSRTHEYGLKAKSLVWEAREQIASVVHAQAEEVYFTSGATESNNIAIMGLAQFGVDQKRKHIVSTAIEHKAVLGPLQELEKRGFELTLIHPDQSGAVTAPAIRNAVRPDTLLVSVMQVNNETGVRQPIADIAEFLVDLEVYFHVDAAQGFGKDLEALRNSHVDLISVSSHKIFGPVGIGALIVRKRGFQRPPLMSLVYGGGQEYGLRPGTIPVPLVVGFGLAAELAECECAIRIKRCKEIRMAGLDALSKLKIKKNGDQSLTLPHILNFSVGGINAEALMLALKDIVAISNGSACTSQSYQPSHVLKSMGLPEQEIDGAVRMSWCHLTEKLDWAEIAKRISAML